MAQTNYTPISLYYSTTASAAPTAGNLVNGELAINITDGKLYYKDNTGAVKVIAGTGGTGVVAGSNTQIQFNNNGVFGASSGMTWDGTNLTASQLRSSGLTSGRVTYASTSGLLVDSANMTFNGTVLTVNTLSLTNALSTANGGTGVTSFTANRVFYASSTSALGQSANLTFDGTTLTAANFTDSSLTSGRVTYATTGGNLTDSASLTFNGTTLTAGGFTTTGTTSTGVLSVTGNTTLGDASADTVTINGTITSNLIFTDNTYDIGAVGATRPRSGYFGTYLNTGTGLFIGVNPNTSFGSAYQYVNMSAATGLYLISSAGSTRMGQNWTFNSSNVDAYGANGPASLYFQTNGEHRWYSAPSNSSGALAALPYENNMLLSRYGNLFLANGGGSSSISATPWGTGYSTVEMKIIGNGVAGSSATLMFNNAYDTGAGSWVYGSSSKFASVMFQDGNSTTWQGTVSTQGAGNAISWQNLMQLTMPASNQMTLTLGQGNGQATERNTIVMANGGFSDQPGNQGTASNGDKMVLYSGANRSAMGIGNDYNWWSQSKSFEWWISPTNLSTSVTKQLTLDQQQLAYGANDSTPKRISVTYSSVPMYMSNSFDGTNGISTISNNIWNTSNGSYTWSSFNNTGYGAATIQLWTNTSGSYITMGAATAANTTPTGSFRLNKYGISAGSSSYPAVMGGTTFPHYLSNASLFNDSATNRVLALDTSASSGSMWLGIGGVQKYANDWDSTAWRRWVNVSSTWYNTHNLLPESGLEREEYNPGFLYEVAEGTTYSSGWNKITYNVTGGTRVLARDGNGYDASSRFTAPCSGWYHFAAQISFGSSNDADGTIKFLLNGNTTSYSPSCSALGGTTYPGSRQVSGTMYLTEGDYIEVWCYFSGNTNLVRSAQPYSGSFSGHFVG